MTNLADHIQEVEKYKQVVEIIDAQERLEKALKIQRQSWNEYICWYGTQEEKEAYHSLIRKMTDREEALIREKFDILKSVTPESAREWSQYYQQSLEELKED